MSYTVKVNQVEHAPSFYVLGDLVSRRASLDGTRLNVVDVVVAPGSGTPLHTHASAEIIYVGTGTLQILQLADGKPAQVTAVAGDVITIPSEVPHAYANKSNEPSRFTALVEDDLLAFLEAVGTGEPLSGPPTEAAIAHLIATGELHGVRFLAA